MREVGYNLDGQCSKGVGEYLGKMNFAYLFTVCAHAEENCPRTFLGFGTHTHWDLEDPAAFEGSDEETMVKFRESRGEIDRRIKDWLRERDME
jgi:arsenate reductase